MEKTITLSIFFSSQLSRISLIFSHISKFFGEIWRKKNRQNLPTKSWLDELYLPHCIKIRHVNGMGQLGKGQIPSHGMGWDWDRNAWDGTGLAQKKYIFMGWDGTGTEIVKNFGMGWDASHPIYIPD